MQDFILQLPFSLNETLKIDIDFHGNRDLKEECPSFFLYHKYILKKIKVEIPTLSTKVP